MNEDVVPRSARFGRLEATGEVEVADSPPGPPPVPFPFANVLRPPSIENEEVSGLRFVVGLKFEAELPPVEPAAFVLPFPAPAIGIGSVPLSVVLTEGSPAPEAGVLFLPIDIPNVPFPFVSPSFHGSLIDTTANFEGYTGGADGGCSAGVAREVGVVCGVLLAAAEFPAKGFGVVLIVVLAEYTNVYTPVRSETRVGSISRGRDDTRLMRLTFWSGEPRVLGQIPY
jgi:hypothetical protein